MESSKIDKIDMIVFQSESSHNPLRPYLPYHGGKGLTSSQAKCSAIAEALERYSARMFGNEVIIKDSYVNLVKSKKYVLDPKKFELNDDFIFRYSDKKRLTG